MLSLIGGSSMAPHLPSMKHSKKRCFLRFAIHCPIRDSGQAKKYEDTSRRHSVSKSRMCAPGDIYDGWASVFRCRARRMQRPVGGGCAGSLRNRRVRQLPERRPLPFHRTRLQTRRKRYPRCASASQPAGSVATRGAGHRLATARARDQTMDER